jgi:hypothetical protein
VMTSPLETAAQQLQFLKRVWSIITQKSSGPITKGNLISFLPDRIYERVNDGISIDELVREVELDNSFDDAVTQALNVLKHDWSKVRPQSKRDLIGALKDGRRYGL